MAREDVSSDDGGPVCVLLFSGGRDSTVAALRLHQRGYRLLLLTVATDHLVGLSAVRQRLLELRAQLPAATRFMHVSAHPREEIGGTSKPTCLPCQLTYLTAGVVAARSFSAASLAFGYVGYQAAWPEQTPEAAAVFRQELNALGLNVEFPVADVVTKAECIAELERYSLTTSALEQKCTRQQNNVPLSNLELQCELVQLTLRFREDVASANPKSFPVIDSGVLGDVVPMPPSRPTFVKVFR